MTDTALSITVEGSAETLKGLAKRKTALMRANLKALRLSSEIVLGKATENVSGKVLNVQTGTLRRRLTYMIDREATISRIGSPTIYAPRHEFGFHGLEVVPAHTRHITHAFGKRLSGRGGMTVYVSYHIRQANTPERPFMRPALRDSRPQIETVFRKSATEALAGGEAGTP